MGVFCLVARTPMQPPVGGLIAPPCTGFDLPVVRNTESCADLLAPQDVQVTQKESAPVIQTGTLVPHQPLAKGKPMEPTQRTNMYGEHKLVDIRTSSRPWNSKLALGISVARGRRSTRLELDVGAVVFRLLLEPILALPAGCALVQSLWHMGGLYVL